MWWNAHGLNKHTQQLSEYLRAHEITMCGVTETWIYDQDVFCDGYRWSKGHEEPPHAVTSRVRKGMGVLSANGLQSVVWHIDQHATWVRIELAPDSLARPLTTDPHQRYLFVATVYAPQYSTARNERAKMWSDLREAVIKYRDLGMIVIGGDLNGRTAANGDTVRNAAGKEIEEFCSSMGLTMANHLDGASGEFSFHKVTRWKAGGGDGRRRRPMARRRASTSVACVNPRSIMPWSIIGLSSSDRLPSR